MMWRLIIGDSTSLDRHQSSPQILSETLLLPHMCVFLVSFLPWLIICPKLPSIIRSLISITLVYYIRLTLLFLVLIVSICDELAFNNHHLATQVLRQVPFCAIVVKVCCDSHNLIIL